MNNEETQKDMVLPSFGGSDNDDVIRGSMLTYVLPSCSSCHKNLESSVKEGLS